MARFPSTRALGSQEPNETTKRALGRVGTIVNGKWRIDWLLGVGGMGAVYAATHRNRKTAALKMLHPELSVDQGARERFLREGYVANSIDHPGSVRVDDDDVAEDGSVYLVMELLEGETIEARWERRNRKLDADEVLSIADQLLDVLIVAHAAGIVHRDVKPDNLFLNRDGQLKILDFGIARLREMSGTNTTTKTGSVMGTPAFMAPEQARGRWESVDHRTDLWAVGATMYTLLTGQYVHDEGTQIETLVLAITTAAKPILEVEPTVPEAVARIVDQALAYDMDGRFSDARVMQDAVREAYRVLNPNSSGRPPQLSLPEASARTLASEPDGVGQSPSTLAAAPVASGPAATAGPTTRTAPDSHPQTKTRPTAIIGVAVVVLFATLGAVAWAVSGGLARPTATAASAAPRGAGQPEPPADAVTSAGTEANGAADDVSAPSLVPAVEPARPSESTPSAAASARKAPTTSVPRPRPMPAPTSKVTPQKAVPDPFSVRR